LALRHTDGNEALHAAGFEIIAHRKTRERMSTAQEITFFHIVMPASPAAALLQSPLMTPCMPAQWGHARLVHFDPAHTDTDIYIHFHNANVLHVGDIWFNGMYHLSTRPRREDCGMISASEKALAIADKGTKIIPVMGRWEREPICRSTAICWRASGIRWPR